MPKQHILTADEVKGAMQAYGQRLGYFIAALDVADDVKEALLALLPEMTPEQLERLSDLLQGAFLAEQTSALDSEFEAELKRIKQEHSTARARLTVETLAKVESLSIKFDRAQVEASD